MPKQNLSESDAERATSDDSSYEECRPTNGQIEGPSEYERQRLSRIAENKARLEALGITKMVYSLVGQVKNVKNKSAKAKKVRNDDDEDYRPDEAEQQRVNSSSEDDKDNSDEDEDYFGGKLSRSRKRKKGSKQKSMQKHPSDSDYIDDNDDAAALRQAIALSLQDAGTCALASDVHVEDTNPAKRKEKVGLEQGKGRRKSKKSFSGRLQMTEDELILHFFQFDETGAGGITIRDLWRMATTHDFTWTDEELATMICCFDSDGDGKLSLEDFRNIAARCNLISQDP